MTIIEYRLTLNVTKHLFTCNQDKGLYTWFHSTNSSRRLKALFRFSVLREKFLFYMDAVQIDPEAFSLAWLYERKFVIDPLYETEK